MLFAIIYESTTNTPQITFVVRAVLAESIFGNSRSLIKSMVRVEDAVMVIAARVDTDAEIRSTRISPSNILERPAPESMFGTR